MFDILQGDNREILKTLPDNSVDAIVTDPPYGIDFLGKTWDANTGALETYAECLRVLKPGGHILAFSAARTYHHLAVTLEQAGFEIRDQLMWLYSSGFPKAQQIKGHQGWKTSLKPAHEPIAMARKPFKGNTTNNMNQHGVGALNIDATRIEYQDEADIKEYLNNKKGPMERGKGVEGEQIGMFETGTGFKQIKREVTVEEDLPQGRFPSNVIGAVEGYQKYFYCPKVSRKERHTGGNNNHPTVKPVELMKYLVKLVTPENGVVLDPFCGSGSTGMAAVELGHRFIGCELDENYVKISQTRITAWNTPEESGTTYEELFDELE